MNPTPVLPSEEWDFSKLVGKPLKKGAKRDDATLARQRAALEWELAREAGSGAPAWLKLKHLSSRPKARSFVREVDEYRFRAWDGKITPWALASVDWPRSPLDWRERPHVLAIRWEHAPVNRIVAELEQWARKTSKAVRARKERAPDPMSDLWAVAAARLRRAGCGNEQVATALRGLPAFVRGRASFDAHGDAARKLAKEGEKLIADAKRIWPMRLTAAQLRAVLGADQPSRKRRKE